MSRTKVQLHDITEAAVTSAAPLAPTAVLQEGVRIQNRGALRKWFLYFMEYKDGGVLHVGLTQDLSRVLQGHLLSPLHSGSTPKYAKYWRLSYRHSDARKLLRWVKARTHSEYQYYMRNPRVFCQIARDVMAVKHYTTSEFRERNIDS